MKIKEVRALGDEELKKQLEAAHKEYFDLRLSAATKQLKATVSFRGLRERLPG